MSLPPANQAVHTFEFLKDELIDAPAAIVFESILEEIGPGLQGPDGSPMPMKVEPWPGGRWFRDLGDNKGHLWGHVQVIKPPALLELCGPFFMSYPGVNHIQYRLTPEAGGTRLKLHHRALGLIPKEHREGIDTGWSFILKRIADRATRQQMVMQPANGR